MQLWQKQWYWIDNRPQVTSFKFQIVHEQLDSWNVLLSLILFFQFAVLNKACSSNPGGGQWIGSRTWSLKKKKIIPLTFSIFGMNLCMDDSKRNLWSLLPWRQPKGWKEFNTDFHWAAKQLFVRKTFSQQAKEKRNTNSCNLLLKPFCNSSWKVTSRPKRANFVCYAWLYFPLELLHLSEQQFTVSAKFVNSCGT